MIHNDLEEVNGETRTQQTYDDGLGEGAREARLLAARRGPVVGRGDEDGDGGGDLLAAARAPEPHHGPDVAVGVDLDRVGEAEDAELRVVGEVVQHEAPGSAAHVLPVILHE